jgi:hypothetical protein
MTPNRETIRCAIKSLRSALSDAGATVSRITRVKVGGHFVVVAQTSDGRRCAVPVTFV